jgi:integrase
MHYQSILKHVIGPDEVDRACNISAEESRSKLKTVPDCPYLGHIRLSDITPEDIQRLISAALERGYSPQTALHMRNVVGALFEHARKMRLFAGDNPARLLSRTRLTRKGPPVLTLAQLKAVLALMQYPEKELTFFAILTDMYVAEICGLQWKCVNLTDEWSDLDGEPIRPKSLAINKQWSLGEFGNLYRESRNRSLPLPEPLMPLLLRLRDRPRFTGPDDFVLVSESGRPISGAHLAAGRLKSIGRDLQIPWLSWHAFRRAHTELTYELGKQSLASHLDPSLAGA